jgi:hypothetical protein
MITAPVFHTLEEAFLYCLDMDASLRERLDGGGRADRGHHARLPELRRGVQGGGEGALSVLTDMDNRYSRSLNLAIFVRAELQDLIALSERDLPRYQGNDSWMLPLPASFVVDCDGFVQALHRPRLPQAYGDRGSDRRSAQGAPPILSW